MDSAEHVSVCGDTDEMKELVLGKVPSHSDHELDVNDFYLAQGSGHGQFTSMLGMKCIYNLVEQMPVLRAVPVIAQILCSAITLSGRVFVMTQNGVKAGVDSGGGDLCLMSVVLSAGVG